MVDYVVGVVKEAKEQELVIDVGILGLALQVPRAESFEKDKPTKIYSYMHWNAENGPSLFGFVNELERTVFKIIISCSGIGPKIALAVLEDLGAQHFLQAISAGDDQALSKVSGIGKKKAEQIIVQLKHKVASLIEGGSVDITDMKDLASYNDLSLALQSLNYSRQEIGKAMEYVKKNAGGSSSFDGLLRQALAYLSKQI